MGNGLSPDEYGLRPAERRLRAVTAELEHDIAQAAPQSAAAIATREPTDEEYVAFALDRLRYRQHKNLAIELWGDTPPANATELADRIDEFVQRTLKPPAATT